MRLRVSNIIWCSDRYHSSPPLSRTCFSRTISMIYICTILGTLILYASKGSKLIQGLLSASSQRGCSTSLDPTKQVVDHYYNRLCFNPRSGHPREKIHFRCQIRDLKSEVMCYIIDIDTSYNLFLGQP